MRLNNIPREQWEKDANITAGIEDLDRLEAAGWKQSPTEIWLKLYELEQHMLFHYDETTLDAETNRRLVGADSMLSSQVNKHFQGEAARIQADRKRNDADSAKTLERKRALYFRLLKDLNWSYTNRAAEDECANVARFRVLSVFLISMGTFCFIIFVRNIEIWRMLNPKPAEELLILAAVSGIWGATFSSMLGLRKHIENAGLNELMIMQRWPYIISRPVLGLGAAAILLFLMKAGILAGEAFPDLAQLTKPTPDTVASTASIPENGKRVYVALNTKNTALLIVWSFVAGFFEQFVPNLLSSRVNAARHDASAKKA